MPYNTRRKSLSLSELGIVVPKRSRTHSHPAPIASVVEGGEPPAKKSKRSHASASPPPSVSTDTAARQRPTTTTATVRIKEEQRKSVGTVELSPPPSPHADGRRNKVDTEGIHDDIVVATIRQLEQTGNRPHLVKELATILSTSLSSAEKYDDLDMWERRRCCANLLDRSSNPSALISSRLSAYINRPWPAISPCPLAKDLSAAHPRRLYFFLTTMPRQPMPTTSEALPKDHRIISPSLSSADDEDEATAALHLRQRQALSPSPEVDLSSPELDDDNTHAPPTPGAPFSGRNSIARERSDSAPTLAHGGRRAASPQLENEERDFKQCANALYEEAQKRRSCQEKQAEDGTTTNHMQDPTGDVVMTTESEQNEEHSDQDHCAAAADLFGQEHLKAVQPSPSIPMLQFSSPVIAPHDGFNSIDLLAMEVEPSPVAAELDSAGREPVLKGDMSSRTTTHGGTHAISSHRNSWKANLVVPSAGPSDLIDSDSLWELSLQSPETVEFEELDDLFDNYI